MIVTRLLRAANFNETARLGQAGRIFLDQHALQAPTPIRHQIPEAAMVPLLRNVPIRPINDGIEADALHWDAALPRPRHLGGDLADPAPLARAVVTGLGDKDGALVACVGPGKQLMERHPTGVARYLLPAQATREVFPLAVVIEVDPHDVEIAGVTAQVGPHPTRQPVPGRELARCVTVSEFCQIGAISRGYYIDPGIDVDDARS